MKKVEIIFKEDTHQYFDNITGDEYLSVTKFISQFHEEFPEEEAAEKKAKKLKTTKEEILALWRRINKEATVYGHEVHNMLENYLKNGIEPTSPRWSKLINNFKRIKFSGELLSEYRVYHDEAKICGTMDLGEVFKDKKLVNIYDFKTNARTGIELQYPADNMYKKYMFPPFEEMPDKNFYHYQVQLCLYGYLWERAGYEIGTVKILWIQPETFQIIPIECDYEYMRPKIIKALEMRKNQIGLYN